MTEQDHKISPDAMRALIAALIIEAVCIIGGIAIYLSTDRMIWIIIGAVAGTGVSAPAFIKFMRASKGKDDA